MGKDGKMSAAHIREALLEKYPSSHYIPVENQITSLISKINVISKERVMSYVPKSGTGLPNQCRGISEDYQNALREVFVEEIWLMHIKGRDHLILRLHLDITSISTYFPSDRTVRSKLSSLRTPQRPGAHQTQPH